MKQPPTAQNSKIVLFLLQTALDDAVKKDMRSNREGIQHAVLGVELVTRESK